jgi:hypothetical protein
MTMANATAVSIVWVMPWLLFCFPPSLLPLIDVNTLQFPPTMGVQMRNVANKDIPQKSPAAKVQPKQKISCGSSRSPKASNVNSLLAKINLPKSQFDGVLSTLGPPGGGDDGLNAPCNLVLLGKAMHPQVNHPISPTSIEAGLDELVPQENATPCNDPTVEHTVRINKNPTSDPPRFYSGCICNESNARLNPSACTRHATRGDINLLNHQGVTVQRTCKKAHHQPTMQTSHCD